MMRQHVRWTRVLLPAALLAPLQSCATVPREVVEATGQPSQYLVCDRQGAPAPPARQFRVGNAGGLLAVGEHELHIPRGALMREVTVTFGEIATDTMGVTLNTEGETFQQPVRLIVGMQRCGATGAPAGDWAIWRVRPGETPEQLRTRIDPVRNAAVTHFRVHSGFVIANRTQF